MSPGQGKPSPGTEPMWRVVWSTPATSPAAKAAEPSQVQVNDPARSRGSVPSRGVAAAAEFATDSWWQRLESAIARRVKRACRLGSARQASQRAQAALDWLWQMQPGQGLRHSGSRGDVSVAVTAAALVEFWHYGHDEAVQATRQWLLARQLANGAFPDATLTHESVWDSAQALEALLLVEGTCPATHDAICRAAQFIASCFDEQGQLVPPTENPGSFDRFAPPQLALACLPPLWEASQRLHQPLWRDLVWQAVQTGRRSWELGRWRDLLDWQVAAATALSDLGLVSEARQAIYHPTARQRADGLVPALPDVDWCSSAGLVRLAALWYRLGEGQRADLALEAVASRQMRGGSFAGSFGPQAAYFAHRPFTSTAIAYLAAARLQVESHFERHADGFPATISADDGRLRWLEQQLSKLPRGARVVDVGCGKGRYLAQLHRGLPQLRWMGLDLSGQMLAALPQGVEARLGNLLRLPVEDGTFDAALCVEALEHSLRPERAVAELCRIVKPGGLVLVIDKNQSWQSLSQHDAWERWFRPREVAAWLSQHCQTVQVQPVSHGSHLQPTGLFLAWRAVRQSAVVPSRKSA